MLFYTPCTRGSLHPSPWADISQINAPHKDPAPQRCTEDADNNHIDKMLAEYGFLESFIDPEVEITLPAYDDSTQCGESVLTDTDAESMDVDRELEQMSQLTLVRFDLNTTPDEGDPKWNYLKKEDVAAGESQESFNKNLRSRLSKDAFCIANAHKNARTRESTTCLCVVLRDEKQYDKKFVFHNGPEAIHKSMNEKAAALNYATRTGYQAHAEVQFIEFLLHRNKQNPERYTHILGMGCSRQHCKECDCLLKLYLGANYHNFTAAMQKEASESEVVIPITEELNQDEGDGIRMKIPEESNVFQVVYKEEAIQDKRYPNYRLSKNMQREIQDKTGLPELEFSDNRFEIGDAVMARSKKRRKIQEGS
jgi:hypothetical protein